MNVCFSKCQLKAFRLLDSFLADDNLRYCMILGAGGVGKTSSLRHYFSLESLERKNYSIHKFAPTHQAKRELQRSLEVGAAAETLAACFGLTSVVHPQTLKEEYREAGVWKAYNDRNTEIKTISSIDPISVVWKFQAFKTVKHDAMQKAVDDGKLLILIVAATARCWARRKRQPRKMSTQTRAWSRA